MKNSMFILVFVGIAIMLGTAQAAPIIVDFDSVAAPPGFGNVPAAQVVATPEVTISGGVILNQSGFANLATTAPNIYATTDFVSPPAGVTGIISGVFSGLVDSITLDVINGFSAATFTLSAFDGGGGLVDSVSLASYPGPGAVGVLSVSGPGIVSFTVTTNQPAGAIDFAIDTLRFNTAAVPEPASIALWGLVSVTGIAAWRRRKQA